MKAVIYCRLAKEEKTKAAIYCRAASADDFTIKGQEKILRNYAAGQMIDVGGIYSDNGASGLTLNRPAFQKMMSGVKSGEINCIIVKNPSRIGRDIIQFRKWLDDMRARRVRVIFVDDCFTSNTPGGFMDKMLQEFFEEYYKELLQCFIM
jgi:DNA invertase Pin-like site-specific DNA recombinase